MMRLGMHPVLLYPSHADRNISLLDICYSVIGYKAAEWELWIIYFWLRESKPWFTLKFVIARSKGTVHPYTEPQLQK